LQNVLCLSSNINWQDARPLLRPSTPPPGDNVVCRFCELILTAPQLLKQPTFKEIQSSNPMRKE